MNPCAGGQLSQQLQQVAPSQRDATCGWKKAIARHMDEYRAATAGNPRPVIVIDFDYEIVQAVLAPQPVARFTWAAPDRTVVSPISRILAPGVGRSNGADREGGPGPGDSVRPPPQPLEPESAPRGSAVTLAFVRQNARTAQGDRENGGSGPQNAACFGSRSPSNMNMD